MLGNRLRSVRRLIRWSQYHLAYPSRKHLRHQRHQLGAKRLAVYNHRLWYCWRYLYLGPPDPYHQTCQMANCRPHGHVRFVLWTSVSPAVFQKAYHAILLTVDSAKTDHNTRGEAAAYSFLTCFTNGILELIPVSLVQMEANDADLGTVFGEPVPLHLFSAFFCPP
jgi:hypothetical protein